MQSPPLSKPGTYVIVLKSNSSISATIGVWGVLDIRRGFYLYVGSAFGPGGVLSRVSRHCREEKAKRWHIDFLREFTTPVAIWYSHVLEHLEHNWAAEMGNMKGLVPVTGFGCTDCQCESHLFFSRGKPDVDVFARAVRHAVQVATCDSLPVRSSD